jgi:hypothetical protein
VTAKRKRRRPRSRPRAASTQSPTDHADADTTEEVEEEEEGDTARVSTRRFLFGGGRTGPYPPLGVSLAVGLRAAGSSPAVLVAAFLTVFAAWAVFAALGFPVPPGPLAALESLPPLHVLFDAQLVQAVAEGTLQLVAVAVGIVALRALTFGILVLLVVDAVRHGTASPRRVLGRLPRVWSGLVQIYLLELALVLAVPLLLESFLGPEVGRLGILLGLVFGLHFLVMAPAIVATEDIRAQDAMRVSTRAARLPGLRHFALVFLYFFVVVFLILQVSPPGILSPATPSILVWSFALATTVVHMGVLGAFAYRWLVVRDEPALGLDEIARLGGGTRTSPASRRGSSTGRPSGKEGRNDPSGRRSKRSG